MSFTDTVKDELMHLDAPKECCALSEICAAVLLSGGLSFRGRDRYGVSVTVNRVSASRYYFSLIKNRLGVTSGIRTVRSNRLGEQTGVELSVPEDSAGEVMRALKLYDPQALFGIRSSPAPEIIKKQCCQAAFLRSAFIITGYVSNPEKEYALTWTCASEQTAECLKRLILSRGIKAEISPRRSRFVVYVKEAEGISVLLTLMGAHSARLKLENARIMKELRNNTNRLTNCDSNNIERTVKSASQQIEDIRLLAAHGGMDKLPPWAKEIASLRLENPDTPLSELGLMCDPPIGKSGVNKRLKRLSELAARLRGDA